MNGDIYEENPQGIKKAQMVVAIRPTARRN